MYDVDELICQECSAFIKNHRWGKIKAGSAGWYFLRDGKAFCPKHRPSWAPKKENTGG